MVMKSLFIDILSNSPPFFRMAGRYAVVKSIARVQLIAHGIGATHDATTGGGEELGVVFGCVPRVARFQNRAVPAIEKP